MTDVVKCNRGGGLFDLGHVTPIARYADCTTFKAPCCGVHTDDRPGLFGGGISRLSDEELRAARTGRPVVGPDGRMQYWGRPTYGKSRRG